MSKEVHTNEDEASEAESQLGRGWMGPLISYLATGGTFGLGGYAIAAITRVQYIETTTGTMVVVGLIIRAFMGNTATLGPKQEWDYIAEREDDDEDD